MATALSNKFKYEVSKAAVNLDTDSIKICLMASGYSFNKDTHHGYSDVSASELATGSGYTANTKTLANSTVTEDDTNDAAITTFDNVTWTASGGNIAAVGAILYDDTHASDIVIGYIDFGGLQTTLDGGTFTISGITISLA